MKGVPNFHMPPPYIYPVDLIELSSSGGLSFYQGLRIDNSLLISFGFAGADKEALPKTEDKTPRISQTLGHPRHRLSDRRKTPNSADIPSPDIFDHLPKKLKPQVQIFVS
jgi:hypothetical protein